MTNPRDHDEDRIDLEPEADDRYQPETEASEIHEPEPESELPLDDQPKPEVVEVTITEPRREAKASEPDEPPLVRPGMGGAKLALILGVLLLLGALVASGVRASGLENTSARIVTLAVAVTLYQSLLHTGAGVAAVMLAARFERRQTGALELAAARMLACVSAFQLVYHLPTIAPGVIGLVIAAILALLSYAAMVWGLFRLSRLELGVVIAGHALLLLGIALGGRLSHLYHSALDAATTVTP